MKRLRRQKLGVSWVQGELTIALLEGKQFKNAWFKSKLTTTLDDFREALSEAVKILGAENADISIVYEAHELSHAFVQVPPLSRNNLKLFLSNRAEQEKVSDKPIYYSFRESLQNRKKNGALLHIINKDFVDGLTKICCELGLFPTKLVPLSEIMEQEILRFSSEKNDVILMLAAFADMTEILVARTDGKILFLRDLKHSAAHGQTSRLVTEIKRSIFYAGQQFQVDVQQVAVIGENAGDIVKSIQGDLPVPVHAASESMKAHFWAEEVVQLSPAVSSNLLPIQVQFKRSSRFVSRTITFMLAATLLFTMAHAANIEYKIWKETSAPINTSPELAQLEKQHAELTRQINATINVEHSISEIENKTTPPIPGWFLSHLSNILPQSLILNVSSVQWENQQWRFTLQGIITGKTSDAPEQLTLLEERIQELGSNIFIAQGWKETWISNIQHGGENAKPVQFIIKGSIQ